MLEIALRFQAAAGHQGKGDADKRGALKLFSDAVSIIFFQEAPVNDAEDILLMVFPVLRRKQGRNPFKLACKTVRAADTITVFQHFCDLLLMFRTVLPELRTTGIFQFSGIRYIEYIPQTGLVSADVNQGNSLGSTHHIPAHLLIPKVITCAGGSIRTLGINHHLVRKWIFIKTAGCAEERRPLLIIAGQTCSSFLGKLCVCLKFIRHRQGPPG